LRSRERRAGPGHATVVGRIRTIADTSYVAEIVVAATLSTQVMGIVAGVSLAVGLSVMWIAARRKGRMSENLSSGGAGPVTRAAVRYVGVGPDQLDASVCLQVALPSIPVCVVAMTIINETWLYVLFAVLFLACAEGLRGLSQDINRARHTEGSD
jgi:hypothetical protein